MQRKRQEIIHANEVSTEKGLENTEATLPH